MEQSSSPDVLLPVSAETRKAPRTVNDRRNAIESMILCQIQELDQLVRSSVASWQGCVHTVAIRHGHRIPYDMPILLTPLDEKTEEPNGEPVRVKGRNLSLFGISFTHSAPLPCRKAAVTLYEQSRVPVTLVVRLRWCRCTRAGIYQSGGRFLRVIEPEPQPR